MNNIAAPGSHKTFFRCRGVKLLLFLAILSALVGVGILYMLFEASRPAEGTIVKTAQPSKAQTPIVKILKTPYYTTSYPGTYELQPRPTNSASLDAQILIARGQDRFGAGSKITLTVETMPEGGVTESSTYNLFESQPELNTLTREQYIGEEVVVATRVDPDYEKTILWPRGNKLLTITLLASSQTSTEDKDLQTVLNNFHW